jgi:SagB-type dehydrogenase family enzyme
VDPHELVALPRPRTRGSARLAQTIAARRSVREFEETPLTDGELSELLWAAQGVTGDDGLRAAPSAGGLYPLETYVALPGGLHHYEPEAHGLTLVREGDARAAMHRASLGQDAIREAPAVFVLAAVYARTGRKYGETWSVRYVDMELGHVAQNLLLQAVALGLGGVPVAAFHEERVRRALALPEHEEPRYLIPVGRPRGDCNP